MEVEEFHLQQAKRTYNETWSLLEADRTPDQDLDLLTTALTSRYHWAAVGGAQEAVVSNWMVSRCLAALGVGDLAVRYAAASADGLPEDAPAWLCASVEEGLARAHAAAGDAAARARHLARAVELVAGEPDDEDRELVEAQIADVPEVGAAG